MCTSHPGTLFDASIVRNVNGQATSFPINLDLVFKGKNNKDKSNPLANLQLQPKDVLFIPTKSQKVNP